MTIKLNRLLVLLLAMTACLSAAADTSRRYYVYNAANGLADNSAQTINCTMTGRLVITTMGQINFFDGQRFSYIDPTTENRYPLSKYTGHPHLYFDRHHHLWLKRRHSVTCVNLTREQFVKSIPEVFSEFGMEEKVEDLFCDSKNETWLLTAKGLFHVETKKTYPVASDLTLLDLDVRGDSLLLFYHNGRDEIISRTTAKVLATVPPVNDVISRKYSNSSVCCQSDGFIYQIRNGEGCAILQRLNLETLQKEVVLKTPYYMSNIVRHDSLLYIPSAYNYWTYNILTGEKKHVESLILANGQRLVTDINALEFDKQGGIWIGTQQRGLLYSRPFAAPFHAIPMSDPKAAELMRQLDRRPAPQTTYLDRPANCVFTDSRGWVWVGTSTGLQLYKNKSAHLPQVINRSDGLLNNVVRCIQEDRLHRIWVGTSYGICALIIDGDKIQSIVRYNQWDGVPNESFAMGRSMRLDDGTIVMQAVDHIVTFSPEDMATLRTSDDFQINPKLVRVFVNGQDVKTGEEIDGNVILDRAITRIKELNLNYDQNTISLTFSALNYFRPQQTYYRVRVSGPGMEGKWQVFTPYHSQGLIDQSGNFHLPLTSLETGHYTIELQTSMFPDHWDQEPYQWIINVNEPWWRASAVLAGFGILLFFMLLTYLVLFVKNANMRARRNNEEQGIIRRIKDFVNRCDIAQGLVLEPMQDEIVHNGYRVGGDVNGEFVKVMLRIVPKVLHRKAKSLTIRELSAMAGLPMSDFYALMTNNIFKSPRPVALELQLQQAAQMLKANPQSDLEEVAAACGFASPNYLIASFLHRFGQTPMEYCNSFIKS